MRRRMGTLSALLIAAGSIVLVAGQLPASATGVNQGVVPSAAPGLTPHILDDPDPNGPAYNVLDMAQAGNRIVVVGQFTQVKNPASAANGGGPTGSAITRNNIFAFDPSTGQVDPNFAPSVTGGIVNAVASGPTLSTGPTVYIGGTFDTIGTTTGTTTIHRLALLNLVDGSIVSTFSPSRYASLPNAAVQDVKYDSTHDRLFLAGSFTSLGAKPHGGLATVTATTGAEDPYVSLTVSGHHNYNGTGAQAAVGAVKIDINPTGNRMIAIGNFKNVTDSAGTYLRDQAVSISLPSTGTAAVDSWTALGYQAPCKRSAFDSWVRDVQWSPDGSYFVIDGTGAYGAPPAPATSPPPGTTAVLCDTAARFNAVDMGTIVNPNWIAYTGGDSLFSVAVTDQAVYVAGHPRWMNNPLAGDNASAGAVPRPGIAALDPVNGLPLTWNPGRNPRGAPLGAQALLATADGIYVGSDTNTIGSPKVQTYTRMKLASFPLVGGAATPSQVTGTLPGTFYLAGPGGLAGVGGTNSVVSRTSDGTTVGTSGDTALTDLGGTTWTDARGAFMVGQQLFYGIKDSSGTFEMARRTFSSGSFGAEEILSRPYKDPAWDGVGTGTTNGGLVYDGVFPNFYGPFSYTNPSGVQVNVAGDLATVTGMFYSNGRVYYTKSGSSSLFYRYFSVDRGVVGAQFFTAASSGFSGTGGMFLNGNDLYVVNSNGNLTKRAFTNGVPSATSTVVDSKNNWKADALWFDPSGSTPPPPVNHNPVAVLSPPSCTGMTCSFDASGSKDPDVGDTLSYAWNFGDGPTQAAGSSATVSHSYTVAGTYPVTVTVTDGRGGSDTATATATPSSTTTTGNVAFRAASQVRTPNGGTSISVTVPAAVQAGDALVLVLSNNGGPTLSAAGVTGTAPTGWTQVGIADAPVSTTNANVAMRGQVFVKVATTADLGSNVTVALSSAAKANLQLIAYSGAVGANPVRVADGAGQSGGTTHSTPGAGTATTGDWVLSVWSDKSSAVETWTAPSGEATRSALSSTGTSGEIASLAGDPGAPVTTTGPVPALTATVPVADSKAVVWTVVIAGS